MLIASVALSVVYYLSTPWRPFTGSWAVKAGSIAILAAMAGRRRAWGLAVALAFSAVGDAFLETLGNLFLAGLAAFLIAHAVYTITFARQWRSPKITPGAALVLAYSAGFCTWLLPQVGTILIPVAVYAAASTAMVISVFTARFANHRAELGAVLFLLSDSVLAVDRFAMPVPLSDWIIWPTYYVGQFLIATGFLGVWASRKLQPGAAAAQP